MSRVYVSSEGDMIDDIAFKIYADESLITLILDANPGLVDQPELLPQGLEIQLPDVPVKATQNAIEDIWG